MPIIFSIQKIILLNLIVAFGLLPTHFILGQDIQVQSGSYVCEFPPVSDLTATITKVSTPDSIPIIVKRSGKFSRFSRMASLTVIVGGLMRRSDVITLAKVPIIGSIIFIGELFKYPKVNKLKSKLEVMLTPKIVDVYSPEMKSSENSELFEKLMEIIE